MYIYIYRYRYRYVYTYIYIYIYILSRVGDRPTATILHAQFHFLIFAWVFKSKYATKICPSQKGQLYFKPPLQFTLYLPLLGGAYFGRIFCFKKRSKNNKNKLVHAESQQLVYLPLLAIFRKGYILFKYFALNTQSKIRNEIVHAESQQLVYLPLLTIIEWKVAMGVLKHGSEEMGRVKHGKEEIRLSKRTELS